MRKDFFLFNFEIFLTFCYFFPNLYNRLFRLVSCECSEHCSLDGHRLAEEEGGGGDGEEGGAGGVGEDQAGGGEGDGGEAVQGGGGRGGAAVQDRAGESEEHEAHNLHCEAKGRLSCLVIV